MVAGGHKLRTYRQGSDVFEGDLPPLTAKDRTVAGRAARPGSAAAPSWPSHANGFAFRTSDNGTPALPFLGKLHPNWVTTTGDWCYLCGSPVIGGRDHHISFDRDHIALNYFFFLVCSMRREWDARGVLIGSSHDFPGVWHRCVSPPVRLASQGSSTRRGSVGDGGAGVGSAMRQHAVSSRRAAAQSPYLLHGTSGQQQQQSHALSGAAAAAAASASHAFSSPEAAKRSLITHMTRSEAERALQSQVGNLATQFAPTWWALRALHERRMELQALMAAAMDPSGHFDPCGGGQATRAVCAQLPPGLIGQGEKTFRADVTRVVAATMPAASPNVLAAFSQKAWGRTNLSRLFDSLHLERIQGKVLARPVQPRSGRSEKSAVMRQLITELHHHVAVARRGDDDDDGGGGGRDGGDGDGLRPRCADGDAASRGRAIMSGQLCEMILARLGSEAVLSMSHLYMDRAWRVAALCGFPDAATLDRLDFC